MLQTWLTASRALYSSTIVLPGMVGGVVAWYDGYFFWPRFLLIIVALFFANIGTNFTNDYYDYKSGVDAADKGREFKRGSEVLLKSGLSARVVLLSAIVCLSLTAAVGLYLVAAVDWRIIFFGLLGMFITYFYTAPPIKLGYRGLGELACWLGCGPLPVIGTYFVLAGRIGAEAVVVSIPVGLLVAAILYIGNVPDAQADATVGKRTISVRLGRRMVRVLGPAFYAAIYLSVILSVVTGVLPSWTLLGLLTVPLVVKLLKLTREHYNNIPRYVPAIMMTVQVFSATTVLIIVGFVVGRLL